MSGLGRIEAYFDGVASQYHQASNRAVWRSVRAREARAIGALVGPVTGEDAFDLGCGAGFYTRWLLESGARHVFAADISQKMLDQLPIEKVTPILADGSLVDPGRRFKVVISAGMLEFVPDPVAVLRNATRLVTADGALTILYPTETLLGRVYRRFHRRNGMSITLFSADGIRQLATRTGWRVDAMRSAGPYSACARLIPNTVS